MSPPQLPPPLPSELMRSSTNDEVYATLAGSIDGDAVRRVFATVATAGANAVSCIHILIQSLGGIVGDGVCLYNFFRTLPIEIAVYNSGGVHSAAAIAYMGGKRRITSARATFMLHMTSVGAQTAKAAGLESLTKSISLDDARIESILREHLTLDEGDWKALPYRDLWLSGEEAVKAGLADEIGEFSPPPGTRLYTI